MLLSVWVYPDRVVVEVTDCGEGFDPLAVGDEESGASSRTAASIERGRGIKLMRMLADSVEIGPKTSGEGTVVRLVKLITPMSRRQGELGSLAC